MDFLLFSFHHLSFYTYFMISTSLNYKYYKKKKKNPCGHDINTRMRKYLRKQARGLQVHGTNHSTLMQKLLWKLCLSFTCSFQSTRRLCTSCGKAKHPHSSGSGCFPKTEDSLMALTGTERRHHGTWADSVPAEFSHPKPCSNQSPGVRKAGAWKNFFQAVSPNPLLVLCQAVNTGLEWLAITVLQSGHRWDDSWFIHTYKSRTRSTCCFPLHQLQYQ